jgi:quercetin dioxygenase-like cupin family protein
MEMKKIYENEFYKIMNVSLKKGETLPKHKATSDAFVIVKYGQGKIVFENRDVLLQHDSTQLIPANETHYLEVTEDFGASIILGKDGDINFS